MRSAQNISYQEITQALYTLSNGAEKTIKRLKEIENAEMISNGSTSYRWIIAACLLEESSFTPAEFNAITSYMNKMNQTLHIYFEERDLQANDQTEVNDDGVLTSLYLEKNKGNNEVQSIFTMRQDREWIKLCKMLEYLLEPSDSQNKQKKREELETLGLSEKEKVDIGLNAENIVLPDPLEKLRTDLLSRLNKDAVAFVHSHIENPTSKDFNKSRLHFTHLAVDHLFWMASKTFFLHRHGEPHFVTRVMQIAHLFGRNKKLLTSRSIDVVKNENVIQIPVQPNDQTPSPSSSYDEGDQTPTGSSDDDSEECSKQKKQIYVDTEVERLFTAVTFKLVEEDKNNIDKLVEEDKNNIDSVVRILRELAKKREAARSQLQKFQENNNSTSELSTIPTDSSQKGSINNLPKLVGSNNFFKLSPDLPQTLKSSMSRGRRNSFS